MASINLQGDTSGSISISAPSVAGSNTLTLPATTQTLATQNALGVRNLIINGDMRIAQRGTSATIPSGTTYQTVDRFLHNVESQFNNISTVTQDLDSLTPPEDFNNYVGIQINTGTALSGNPYFNFRQNIEGNNAQHLKLGAVNAKTFTISFWVRSTLTGDFSFSLRNAASNRVYVTTYNIASANTWEKKTITITGDTTGTWATDNTIGLSVNWGLGNSSGSFSTSTLNQWQTGSFTGATTGVDLVATTNAKWYITGVQLEISDGEATPFEHRPYDMELNRCLRYYFKHAQNGSNTMYGIGHCRSNYMRGLLHLPVPMRANPTMSNTGTDADYYLTSGTTDHYSFTTRPTKDGGSPYVVNFRVQVSSLTNGYAAVLYMNSANSYLAFDAEL